MLTLNYFNEDKLKTLNGLQKRGWSTDRLQIVEDVAILDIERKELQTQLDLLKMEVNQASKEIGILIGRGKHQEVEEIKQKISTNKSSITQLEEKSKINKDTLQDLMYKIPNIPHDSVPAGKSAEDNEVYQSWD